jgi:hypothetical protein
MKVSKTFELITAESAADGVSEDSGFEYMDYECSIEEAVDRVEDELGYFDGLHSFPTIYGCSEDVDYTDGTTTTYALHFDGSPADLAELKSRLENSRFNK